MKNSANKTPKKRGRPKKDAPKKDTTAKDLKGSRFALGKAPEHLTKKQQAQLEFIAKADKRLYRSYLLKEKLRLVFQCENVAIAKEELDGWIKWAQHCRICAAFSFASANPFNISYTSPWSRPLALR